MRSKWGASTWVGGSLVAIAIGVAVFAPWIALTDPVMDANLMDAELPPSWDHPFGTDAQGRDIYSRICYGARISLDQSKEAIAVWGIYTLAITLLLLGAAGTFRGLINAFPPFFAVGQATGLPSAGLLVIVMGLAFMGAVPFLQRELRWHRTPSGTAAGSVLLGFLFALGWTPCIGPILAGIFAMAASQETVGQGVRLLAVYSLGLGVPFFAAALAIVPTATDDEVAARRSALDLAGASVNLGFKLREGHWSGTVQRGVISVGNKIMAENTVHSRKKIR